MSRYCAKKGCRRYARRPTTMCCSHAGKEGSVETVHSRRTRGGVAPKVRSKKVGFFGTFVLENVDVFDAINSWVEKHTSGADAEALLRGARCFLEPGDGMAITASLAAVVEEARVKIAFPLHKTTIYADVAGISIAPAKSHRSNFWTCGNTHRDFSDVQQAGVYTFLLCLDVMTEDNGAIQFWPCSQKCESDPKHTTRGIERMNLVPEVLVGKRGTVFVFDARLLHKPLPNKSPIQRTLLGWQVSKPSLVLETINE
jgi:hypothetical protein